LHVYKIDRVNPYLPSFLARFSIKKLQRDIYKRFGVRLDMDIRYSSCYKPEISLLDIRYKGNDWMPQFCFNIIRNKKGVYLHSLRLPKELRNKGIGKYCVDWLKGFCRRYGLFYIVLGSVEEAKNFWEKLGFTQIDEDDKKEYPHY